jgi:hypothetical protein
MPTRSHRHSPETAVLRPLSLRCLRSRSSVRRQTSLPDGRRARHAKRSRRAEYDETSTYDRSYAFSTTVADTSMGYWQRHLINAYDRPRHPPPSPIYSAGWSLERPPAAAYHLGLAAASPAIHASSPVHRQDGDLQSSQSTGVGVNFRRRIAHVEGGDRCVRLVSARPITSSLVTVTPSLPETGSGPSRLATRAMPLSRTVGQRGRHQLCRPKLRPPSGRRSSRGSGAVEGRPLQSSRSQTSPRCTTSPHQRPGYDYALRDNSTTCVQLRETLLLLLRPPPAARLVVSASQPCRPRVLNAAAETTAWRSSSNGRRSVDAAAARESYSTDFRSARAHPAQRRTSLVASGESALSPLEGTFEKEG